MEKTTTCNGDIPYTNLIEVLNADNLRHLMAHAQEQLLERNAAIYDRATEADRVYIVKKGRVKLYTHGEDGKEVLKSLIHAGEIFGEGAMFGESCRRDFTAAMDEHTVVLEIMAADAIQLMRDLPEFGFSVTQQIAEKLRSAEKRIEALTFQNSRERIIEFLKETARKQGRKVGYETLLRPFLTHQDIGSLTTTSRQTVSSVLNELKGSNKIYYDRQRLLIRDMAGL
jgi:CRP/FNR family transcriptional regulator, cyclic AMP receptor protein